MGKKRAVDSTSDPQTMTSDERRDEAAGILAVGVVRAMALRMKGSLKVSESAPEALEDPEDAGLSVSSLGPIGGPDPKPQPDPKGGTRDRSNRSRDR